MVVRTGEKGKADTKVLLSGDEVLHTKKRFRGSCPIAFSIFFNIVMIILLVGAGIYLYRYRRQLCHMHAQFESERLDELGVPYEIKGCDVVPISDEHTAKMDGEDSDERAEGLLVLDDNSDDYPSQPYSTEGTLSDQHRRRHHHHRHHRYHPRRHGNNQLGYGRQNEDGNPKQHGKVPRRSWRLNSSSEGPPKGTFSP